MAVTRKRYGNGSRRLFSSNRQEKTKPIASQPSVKSEEVTRSEISNLYAAMNDSEDIFAEIAETEDKITKETKAETKTITSKKDRYVKEMVKKIKAGEIDYQKLIQLREQLQYKHDHPGSEIYLSKDAAALLKKIDKTVQKIYQES